HQVRTDGQGYYSFKGIPEGTYQVKFSKSKFATKYVTQSIVVGQTQTLNVALTPN
ncbi:carboxypeptidase regulatory-like domain-containing protein, partial [bacterium]|nr:carboxypeptidase regulatory-like domain-containing protein [bacterium]